MPRGRPRTPIERMEARSPDGKTPGKRNLPARIETAPDRAVPVPASNFTGRGLDEWQKVWLAGWWLNREQDYHWVEMIAQAYDDIDVFRARVKEDGLVQKGSLGQPVAHPLIAEIRRAEATIQKCLSVLGFSPSDRARLNLVEAKTRNALEELMSRAQRD